MLEVSHWLPYPLVEELIHMDMIRHQLHLEDSVVLSTNQLSLV